MTSNYSITDVQAEEIYYKNERSHSIYLGDLLHYIIVIQEIEYIMRSNTLYHTYAGHIQISSNYSSGSRRNEIH